MRREQSVAGDRPNSSTQSWRVGSAICYPLHYLLSIAAHSGPFLRRDPDAVHGSSEWAEAQPKNILPIAFCPFHPHLGELLEDFEAFKACCALVVKIYGHLATIPTASIRNRSLILWLIV